MCVSVLVKLKRCTYGKSCSWNLFFWKLPGFWFKSQHNQISSTSWRFEELLFPAWCLVIVKIDAVAEHYGQCLCVGRVCGVRGLPLSHCDSFAQVNLFFWLIGRPANIGVQLAVVSRDQSLVLSIDFEGADGCVLRLIKLAYNGGIHCCIHVDYVTALVVGSCREMLAIRWHWNEKLIIQLITFH